MNNKTAKLLICIILIISCKDKKTNNLNYFQFDEIEYYNKNINENIFFDDYEKSKFTDDDKKLFKIVVNEYPLNLNDSLFTLNLIKFGYIKKRVEKSKFFRINQIFSKSDCTALTTKGCVPIYRDIFIFKEKGEITGVAKVCFNCRNAYIIGSKHNWDSFGECGDYEKLQQIIKTIK